MGITFYGVKTISNCQLIAAFFLLECKFLVVLFCTSTPIFAAVAIIFLPYLYLNFLESDKNIYSMISVKLILSSISSAFLTWSVNQTSGEENSVLTIFIIVKECSKIFISCPNSLFRTKLNKILDVHW